MGFGLANDKVYTGNYLTRDVSHAEAHESTEQKLEKQAKIEQVGAPLRAEAAPTHPGDRSPNVAYAEMTKRDVGASGEAMLKGMDIVSKDQNKSSDSQEETRKQQQQQARADTKG